MNSARGVVRLTSVLALTGLSISLSLTVSPALHAQTPGGPPGPGGGRGGMGGFRTERELVRQFDRDGDKRLNLEERKAAREFLARSPERPRGPGRNRAPEKPPAPGARVSPSDVEKYPEAPLYDPTLVRTLFLEFESPDWEAELGAFYNTDVEVPARLTVDGQVYDGVGVHYRGASSFSTVAEGFKRSLNLSLDFTDKTQRLHGYRTLNLLNSHTDPTFLRTILATHIAREYMPAPRANYVRLVINGESWGVYVNAQQFNTDFTRDAFQSTKGRRWKVPGSPRGSGGLNYLGPETEPYRRIYEIKSKDEPAAWAELIRLCRTLHETRPEDLEAALKPILDVDGALKFLALENALINTDGYWIRASDYHLYQDEAGVFHIIMHDANETFRLPEGPGMSRDSRIDGVRLDPLMGHDNPDRPLLQKLLAVPALRAQYLGYVRHIAENWLDWKVLGPLAARYQDLIEADVRADTRKLYNDEMFRRGVTEDVEETGFRGPRRSISLKSFAEQRRDYLLNHEALKPGSAPSPSPAPPSAR